MIRNFTLGTLAVLTCMSTAAWAEHYDASLTGNLVSSNPGKELAMPLLKGLDTDGDGLNDQFSFNFNLYKAGTSEKLFGTPVRKYAIQAPCDQPVSPYGNAGAYHFRYADGRLHALIWMYMQCYDQADMTYKMVYGTGVYSTVAGQVSSEGTWSKLIKGGNPAELFMVDVDGDGVEEIQALIYINRTATAGDKLRVVFMDPTTGKVEGDDTYAVNNLSQ